MNDVLIIGLGAAGYTSAIYCARYKLTVTIVGQEEGGMGMTAAEARRLLKAMIDETIDVSTEGAPECRLAAAKLVQEEMKFRLANEGMTLLPIMIRGFIPNYLLQTKKRSGQIIFSLRI